MDLFRRKSVETRSGGTGYTAAIMAARESWISGQSGLAELTSTVQSCVSLWEGALAASDVTGTDMLDRRTMALCARSLALRGEVVALITADGIVPAADWDVSTRNGIPRAYRFSISEAGGGRTETALAGEVLHFRIGSDAATPWTGQAPLARSGLSASLLHEVETALRDVFRDAPLGSQIVHLPDSSADDMEQLRSAFRGRRGSTLVIEGVAQSTAAGMNPQIGQKPDQLSPDLQKATHVEALAAAQDGVALAYGVLPSMLTRSAQGNAIREGQRHLATWTVQPMADLMAEEATRKLGEPVTIDVMRNLQAFDTGGRARALKTIIDAMAAAKAAGVDPAPALNMVDWSE
ncbi:phage portal protein [Microbulbifer sp. S227A]|uniref:phage portal protein n=1 Tax=Microbulbifer sp. S227A TaxID=3415131 RepID=UPI003C7D88D4